MADEPTADPIAVLLARIEVKLDNSLAEQNRHASTLDRHDGRISKLENRAAVLETRNESDSQHDQRSYSGKTVLWSAVSAVVAALALFVVVILAVRSGG